MVNSKRYWENPSKYRKKAKKYYYANKNKRLKYQGDYGIKHKGECKERQYKWRRKQRERFLKQHKEHAKKYRKIYPEKIVAHQLVRKIKITKNDCCRLCGKRTSLEKHHPDYNRPLEIVILCRKCHHNLHDGGDSYL